MRAAPLDDYEEEEPRSLWSRIKDRFGVGEFEESEELYDEAGGRLRPAMFRPTRIHHISVWMTISSVDQAQAAADGLKSGRQQIVNLENASPEICGRVIDFLNGVTYALDGYVEKVGDRVYLFTPANCEIEIESQDRQAAREQFIGS